LAINTNTDKQDHCSLRIDGTSLVIGAAMQHQTINARRAFVPILIY